MAKKHIHKYHKVMVNGEKLFACGLPTCTHHMPKHYENLLEGRAFICWNCNEHGILDKDNMKYDFPWCSECKLKDKLNIAGVNDNSIPDHNSAVKVALNYHEPDKDKTEVIVDQKVIANLFK